MWLWQIGDDANSKLLMLLMLKFSWEIVGDGWVTAESSAFRQFNVRFELFGPLKRLNAGAPKDY